MARSVNLLVAPDAVWGGSVLRRSGLEGGYDDYRRRFQAPDGTRWLVVVPGDALNGLRCGRIVVLATSISEHARRTGLTAVARGAIDEWVRTCLSHRFGPGTRVDVV